MNNTLILNVDDYDASRYPRTRVLQRAGFTVLEAATGADALRIAHDAVPALIVLDVNLPDMSGFDVCRAIRNDPTLAHSIVLHLSASSVAVQNRLDGLDSGGDSYLTEPIDPDELVANVRALLRLRAAEFALRETNRTLETIISSSPLCIISSDLTGVVTSWNHAAERIFGWTAEELIGRPYPLVPEHLRTEYAASMVDVSAGRMMTGLETQRRHKTGELLDVSLSLAPLRNAHGAITGVLAIIEDITARRRVERELAQLFTEVRRANEAKDDFLATLSHELRTPLNTMLGWIRMLRREEIAPERRAHALEVVERNANAQLRLVEDLLDVSRIASGKLRLEAGDADLREIARLAVEALRPAIEARGLRFLVQLPDEPVPIDGDRVRLQQVLTNILSNALKFTAAGEVALSLAVHGAQARVTVRDTGCGIEPAFLPHVFDRFRQQDSSALRSQGGLGIGLAIVRHIVEAHGGHVTAQSPGANGGSTFEVVLPIFRRS